MYPCSHSFLSPLVFTGFVLFLCCFCVVLCWHFTFTDMIIHLIYKKSSIFFCNLNNYEIVTHSPGQLDRLSPGNKKTPARGVNAVMRHRGFEPRTTWLKVYTFTFYNFCNFYILLNFIYSIGRNYIDDSYFLLFNISLNNFVSQMLVKILDNFISIFYQYLVLFIYGII